MIQITLICFHLNSLIMTKRNYRNKIMSLKISSTVCGTNLEYGFEDLKEHCDVDT